MERSKSEMAPVTGRMLAPTPILLILIHLRPIPPFILETTRVRGTKLVVECRRMYPTINAMDFASAAMLTTAMVAASKARVGSRAEKKRYRR